MSLDYPLLISQWNTLVNNETARLQNTKPIQLAVAQDYSFVFVPCMSTVKAFDIWSGTTSLTFQGHYESINCCWFNAEDKELYTGGHDRQILVWSPSKLHSDEMGIENDNSKRWKVPAPNEDNIGHAFSVANFH